MPRGRKAQNTIESTLAQLVPNGECLVWPGYRNKDGYGVITFGKTRRLVHRLAFEQAHGPIPEGLKVLHNCDNPPCANTDHLFLGTPTDNAADRDTKGRQARGASHGRAGLTETAVRSIRSSSAPLHVLATEHGVSVPQISKIRNRRAWRHVA